MEGEGVSPVSLSVLSMRVIIDSREQDPLSFSLNEVVSEITVGKLDFGDYSAIYQDKEEWKSPLFFTRKSIGDLYSTLANEENHQRFKREMYRAKDSSAQLILAIEGTDQDIFDGHKYSKLPGQTMMKILDTLWMKYDLYPMFCENRRVMAWRMVNLWSTFRRHWKK